jgi:hypothetical protein
MVVNNIRRREKKRGKFLEGKCCKKGKIKGEKKKTFF